MEFSDEEANRVLREMRRRNESYISASLTVAKARAAGRRKEPFVFAKLEQLCDPASAGRGDCSPERQARYEYLYYVRQPSLLTLSELAALIQHQAYGR